MNIIPWTRPAPRECSIPKATEWAWDFEKLEFKTHGGKLYRVFENEAIKIWVWKIFKTIRLEEVVYGPHYGSDFMSLIGSGYTPGFVKSEAERMAREAVMAKLSDYIVDMKDFDVRFHGATLEVRFTLVTIYSEEAMTFAL